MTTGNFIGDFIIGIYNFFTTIIPFFFNLLPEDPLYLDINQSIGALSGNAWVQTGLGWLNWFLPMQFIIGSFKAWLVCFLIVKAIGVGLRLARILP